MKTPPGSVFRFCGTEDGDPQDCVDWAIAALAAGVDSPNLRILAGLESPLDSHEVKQHAVKALKELEINIPQGEAAVSAYAYDLVREIIINPDVLRSNLIKLGNVCAEEALQGDIYDFYLLRWAYEDLQTQEVQFYWEGANRSNIQEVVMQRCAEWVTTYEKKLNGTH